MSQFQAVIFDIDGVLEFQGRPYPGAVELVNSLREHGIRLCFLTNSTLKSRRSAAERLQKKGFSVSETEVITASSATADYLHHHKPRSIWVLLDREGQDEFAGFPRDEENPEYIVVGDHRSQANFDTLNRALRCLLRGAKLVAMQSELLDTSMGEAELNVGAWALMLEMASGVPAVSIGKPNPYAFELAVRQLGVERDHILMVGDRVETDILGAQLFGIRSALVRQGEFDSKDLDGDVHPDYLLNSVADVLEIVTNGRS